MHIDHAGGTKASRPQHDLVLQRLRGDDVLVITPMVTLGADLRDRGIVLKVLEQSIDTATAEGRAMFGILSVLAEYQRELIVANTRDGLSAARTRGEAAEQWKRGSGPGARRGSGS
ncbi:recombinase family protein (plasmid) [Rhodococcus opacus]|nr:recombinase family protein [Rhodococcus opacus]UNN05125.1 recombinase family protein [Rhodococcus opacus]